MTDDHEVTARGTATGRDVASYLAGFIAGYWHGHEFALNPTDDGVGEDEEGSAPGDADAPTAAPPPDLPGATRPLPAYAGDGSSRGSAASSLPAIRQPALPDDVKLAAELEAMYVHRGMTQALAVMVEIFRDCDMPVAASICERAYRMEDPAEDRR